MMPPAERVKKMGGLEFVDISQSGRRCATVDDLNLALDGCLSFLSFLFCLLSCFCESCRCLGCQLNGASRLQTASGTTTPPSKPRRIRAEEGELAFQLFTPQPIASSAKSPLFSRVLVDSFSRFRRGENRPKLSVVRKVPAKPADPRLALADFLPA